LVLDCGPVTFAATRIVIASVGTFGYMLVPGRLVIPGPLIFPWNGPRGFFDRLLHAHAGRHPVGKIARENVWTGNLAVFDVQRHCGDGFLLHYRCQYSLL